MCRSFSMAWSTLFRLTVLQALQQKLQQLEMQSEKFADSVPAWHSAVQYLRQASALDHTDLSALALAPATLEASSLSEPMEKAVSSLLVWAQTAREQSARSQGESLT